MARVGEEFPLECPSCGGDIRLIALIKEPGPIRKILTHLGEPLEPPPVSPARGPLTDWGELVQADDDRAIFQASPTSCLRSTSTASEGIPCDGADGPREERFQGQSAPTRKIRSWAWIGSPSAPPRSDRI
jgi:hypothetical protein